MRSNFTASNFKEIKKRVFPNSSLSGLSKNILYTTHFCWNKIVSQRKTTELKWQQVSLERLEAVEKALAEAAKYNHPGKYQHGGWECCGESDPRGICWKVVNGHVCDITGSWPPFWDCSAARNCEMHTTR